MAGRYVRLGPTTPTPSEDVGGPDTLDMLSRYLAKVPGLNALTGPLGLAGAIKEGDPLQALLAAGSTANTISGAVGGPTVASGLQSLFDLGTGATPAVAAAPTITSGLSSLGANLFNPATIFSSMLGIGGMAGQMEAEKVAQAMRKRLAGELNTGLQDIAATDPGDLDSLRSGLRALPKLSHAVGLGADQVEQRIPALRSKVSGALVKGLDAAEGQGIDTSSVTEFPVQLSPDASIQDVRTEGAQPGDDQMKRVLQHLLGGEYGGDAENLAQVLSATRDQLRNPNAYNGGNPAEVTWSGILTHGPDSLWDKVFTPDKLAEIEARGGLGDLANFQLDPGKANDLLNRENRTVSIRNAAGDLGGPQLTPEGTTEDDWRLAPRDSTLGHGWLLPPSGAIEDVQGTLGSAGVTPGHYESGIKGLQDYLDTNPPEWDPFKWPRGPGSVSWGGSAP